jgi:hypothetical protein
MELVTLLGGETHKLVITLNNERIPMVASRNQCFATLKGHAHGLLYEFSRHSIIMCTMSSLWYKQLVCFDYLQNELMFDMIEYSVRKPL